MTDFARDYAADFDLEDPELSERWDEVLPHMQATCPVARSNVGEGYWVISGYDDVNAVGKDWQTFSSADGFMVNRPEGMPFFAPAEVDPPLQKALRDTLDPFLRKTEMTKIEPGVRAYADSLIDSFIDDGEVELVSRFAEPLPQHVFGSMVSGMNPADMPYLLQCLSFLAPPEERAAGFGRAMEYADSYLKERQSQAPRGDIVDALIAFDYEGYGWADKIGTMCQLTVGAIGTTGFAFSGGMHHLATHAADRDALVADRSKLGKAVEEFLRMYTGVAVMARRTTVDTEVGGVKIAAGERVLLNYGAASRDPAVCPHPDQVDINRNAVRHVAFGAGVHRCIGQHMARMVLNIGYDQLLNRIPEFRVPDGFEPRYETGSTRHMVELPLIFDKTQPSTLAAANQKVSA